ncbi:MAG TPA: hypothetical protein VN603_00730, partial [Candidatus Acidoferrales bacterium]|nr:hypothetical protein [Candidatus Acidoferrales bacterium]
VFEPVLTQALGTRKFRVIGYMYSAMSKKVEDSDYFTTTDWAAKHRDVIGRFTRVMHDANVYVAAHESETIPIIATSMKIDPAILTRMNRPGRPPYVEAADIQPLIDLAAKYGLISSVFPAQQLISEFALRRPR